LIAVPQSTNSSKKVTLMAFYQWSTTAASNANSDPTINWAEGQSPSSVNDSARAGNARLREWGNDISGQITTGGTSTAYTVTSNQVFDTLAHLNGQMIAFVPHATCGTTVTLNVDGLGAKPLRTSPGIEVPAGLLIQGTPYVATYNNSDAAFYLRGFYSLPYAIPIGGLLPYVGATAPSSSFALPFGQSISRATYAALFSLVGTTFGSVDGSSFNLPDLRGRAILGLDNLGGSPANILQATTTISTTSGSPTATVASATNIAPGMVIVSANVPAGTTVAAITGTTVTLSANATATASGTAARFSAVSDAQAIGGTGGAQNHTLSIPEIPTITPAGTIGGSQTITNNLVWDGVNNDVSGGSGQHRDNATNTVINGSSFTFAGTAFGGGLPHSTINPCMVLPFILRVI
jgi:microcystin-dependent protein